MISICTFSTTDRFYMLPGLLDSCSKAIKNIKHEYIFVFYNEQYLFIPDNSIFKIIKGRFNAGKCRNILSEMATGDIVCFLDVDMSVPENYFEIAMNECTDEKVWFPLYNRNGVIENGYGNLCIKSSVLNKYRPLWPESERWGGEDIDAGLLLKKNKLKIKPRFYPEGFIHRKHDRLGPWYTQ